MRSGMRGVFLCGVFAAGLSLTPAQAASGCPEKPSLVIVALFDLSGSTGSSRQRYLQDFESVIDRFTASRGGQVPFNGEVLIAGDTITENSLASSTFPIYGCFPEYSMWKSNPRSHASAMVRGQDAFREQARKLLGSDSSAKQTDILNSLALSEKVFGGVAGRGASHKYLLIFSDMVEEGARYNFLKRDLSAAGIRGILEAERRGGTLAKLAGVTVWVSGAAAGAGTKMTPTRIREIQNFWTAYFEAAGASLTQDRYSGTLVNFRLPE
ncbi:MAG: hypothetical protein SGI92_01585 [Bryobacteraceae bacterium]|nr:hypothetical protein [Bryobacteraceae bacterium]